MIQETLEQALIRPGVPRVFTHAQGSCNGWVLWSVQGGFCLSCGAGPLEPGQYVMAGESAARAT